MRPEGSQPLESTEVGAVPHVTAHKMVDQVTRAYVTGLNLVDMRMSDAKARTALAQPPY